MPEFIPENNLPNNQAAKLLLAEGADSQSLYLLQLARQGLEKVAQNLQDELEQALYQLENQKPSLAQEILDNGDDLPLAGLNREQAEQEVLQRIEEVLAEN